MSLYNLLHGVNYLTPVLLAVLDIDQKSGKWNSGRFRDIHLNENGTKIILLTRNGGGNREHYFPHDIVKHPNYIKDYDDDFDCTYAYIEFSVPRGSKLLLKKLATGERLRTLKEKTEEYLDKLKKGEIEVPKEIKQIFKEIDMGLKRGAGHDSGSKDSR